MSQIYLSAKYKAQTGTSAGASSNVGIPLAQDHEGKVRMAVFKYTALGTEITGDSVYLGKLPVGAKVLRANGQIEATATVGTGVTVRVGDQTTANRWAGTIDISAGGLFAFTATDGTEIVEPTAIVGPTVFGTVAATDDTVVLTFVAISAITAAKVIIVRVPYLMP